MKSFLETWKPVVGYEGLYEVSDFGEVRSLGRWVNTRGGGKRFLKGKVLRPQKNIWGYLFVTLYKEGKSKMHTVHRLVATAFIPNPDNLPEINHKDEDKTSNVATNLEYCDRKYNHNYGTVNQRISAAQRNDPNRSKKLVQLTLDYVFVKEWPSTAECERNGFSSSAVSACCRNKYWLQKNVHKGFRWMYAEDYYSIAKILSEYSCQSFL